LSCSLRLPEAERRKPNAQKEKALRQSQPRWQELNAGLVFLTTTCLSYLVLRSSMKNSA